MKNLPEKYIFDQLPEASIITSKDGMISAWNKKAEHLFGLSSKEALSQNIHDLLFDQEHIARETALLQNLQAKNNEFSFTLKARISPTQFTQILMFVKLLFNEQGVLLGHLRTITDLNNSKNQNWMSSVLEHISSGVTISDVNQEDNPLIYVNKAFELITGYSSDEVLGKNCRFLQGDKKNQPALKALRAAISQKKPCSVILENFKKDGTPFINQFNISVVYNSFGQPTHFVGIQNDITDKVKNEVELNRQKEIAITASKMAVVGEMAGGICHEINNPLMVLRTHIDDIKEQMNDLHELGLPIVQSLDKMDTTINRIAKIVKSLKDLSSQTEYRRLQFESIESLIEETLALTQDKLNKAKADLILEKKDELYVPMNKIEIQQVLSNLINNSCDAIEKSHDKRIILNVQMVKDYCVLSISDYGVGIEEDIKNSLFTPFFTTKDLEKGTGLGLTISKRIMQSHGGKIEITHLKTPTTFQIFLKADQS